MDKPVMEPKFWQSLADADPQGLGLTARDVEDWFDKVFLAYSGRGYSCHTRAIREWFSRASAHEVIEGMEAGNRRRAMRESRDLAALAVAYEAGKAEASDEVVVDLFSKVGGSR